MVVISLTDCPAKLKGDLTKWLCEINTGVYVGKVSARVREELWTRICDNLSHGKATMVYTAANEQGMEFRVHHTTWRPTDFDGLTLMKRPLPQMGIKQQESGETEESRAAKLLKARKIQVAVQKKHTNDGFVIVDLETSGLSPQKDEILEIGAIHVINQAIIDRFSGLVRARKKIPEAITALTGITQELLDAEGQALETVLDSFRKFAGNRKLIYHNAGFDRAFLDNACVLCKIPAFQNEYTDTMVLAKRLLDDVPNYRLETLANYFGWEGKQAHRAVQDCEETLFVYCKLKEIEDAGY